MLRSIILALSVTLAACASAPSTPPPLSACALSEADRAWVDRSVDAWRFASREIAEIAPVEGFQAVLFDAQCALRSDNALSSDNAAAVMWTATPHTGEVMMPDGQAVPVGVISATVGADDVTFFMMSTPSVWRAGGLDRGGPVALEDTMVAVLLHEASHIAQSGPYGQRIGALIEQNNLPDSFGDDTLQHTFRNNAEFAASIARETELFLAAAAARDDAQAKRLAREARQMMHARQERWLVGEYVYFVEAENIWLTFEGAGQWVGYQWMVHPAGGGVAQADAMAGFARGAGWWSQSEGFALAMAVDRIVGSGWKRHAFGGGAHTLLEMLDQALVE